MARVDWKQRLVDDKGGKCVDCKRMPHLAAMQFDHLDPVLKKYPIATMLVSTSSWEAILEEADKCDLVCANCHAIRTHDRRVAKALAKAA